MGSTTSNLMLDLQIHRNTSLQRNSAFESKHSTEQLKDPLETMSAQQQVVPTDGKRTKLLLDMPDEILKQILDHISDKASVHHAQLVNKRLYAIATESLYRHFHMTLVPDFAMSNTYACYLPSHTAGHDFIRELEVSLIVNHNQDPTRAYQWLDQLLGHLPPNKLLYFRSNFNRPLPAYVLKKLWLGQATLKNIEIFPSWTVDNFTPRNIADHFLSIKELVERADFKELESIRVVPDCSETAALCSAVLQKGQPYTDAKSAGLTTYSTMNTTGEKRKAKMITTLEIDGCRWIEDAEQGMTAEDQLVESLFAHVPRVHPGQKGTLGFLTTLHLKDVSLEKSRSTWHTYLSLGKLQRLQLHYCSGVDIFLLELTSDDSDVPILKSFSIIHETEQDPDHLSEAIDKLLHFTGDEMQDLELCLRNASGLPRPCGIAQHGKSLRTLVLDVKSPDGWNGPDGYLVYDEPSLKSMLEPCTQLRELALGMQNYSYSYHGYDRSTDVELDIAKDVQAVFESTALDVLNILNLPTEYDRPHVRPFADHALGRVANDIYRIQYRTNTRLLKVLAFGSYQLSRRDPLFFVPTEIKVLSRTGIYFAAEVPLTALRAEGLACRMLDHKRRDFNTHHRKLFNRSDAAIELPDDSEDIW